MIRIALVEDEDVYVQSFKENISRYEKNREVKINLTVFDDGLKILENYNGSFDIIFLDIKMKFMDGMTVAKKIRTMDTEVVIVFITNLTQYAIKGYEVDALDYMLKPVSYFAFSQKLDKAISRIKHAEDTYIGVIYENALKKIKLRDIYYIESQGHIQTFHTITGEIHIRDKMTTIEKKLKTHDFFRSNKGYLVNMRYVSGIENGCCIIAGDRLIISRNRKKVFMDTLTRYMSNNIL